MRCKLGQKKTQRIREILGPRWQVASATVRGGHEHFAAHVTCVRPDGMNCYMKVNYKTGETTELQAPEDCDQSQPWA